MKNRLPFLIVISLFFFSCKERSVVNADDINPFLKNQQATAHKVSKQLEEIDFWKNRLAKDTGSTVDKLQIGWLYSGLFGLTGDVRHLHAADSLIKICAKADGDFDPDIYFTLSQNAITRHSFREAYELVELAEKKGSNKYISTLLAFDAAMELGRYSEAHRRLESLREKDKFDYLVRKAKLEDHKGNLDEAIKLMEQAFLKVKHLNKPALYCWALSNLSDMYSHAGKIEKAYHGYREVLSKDSSYLYALKGIAWISYSHDKNTEEAKRIIHFILSQTEMPDLYLLLAEIEEYTGNMNSKEQYTKTFLQKVSRPGYGSMYNKYFIEIYADNATTSDEAVKIAEDETKNRMTPETCSWLAWAQYKKGNIKEALMLYRNFVLDKTFEPAALLCGAYIMKDAGEKKLAKKLFSECLASSFELGPLAHRDIKAQLSSL